MSDYNFIDTSFFGYDGIQVTKNIPTKVSDDIVVEAALQININEESYTVVMRTPGNDFELIRGLLFAEDIYRDKKSLQLNIVEQHENGFSIINATIPKNTLGKGYLNKRTLLSVSSCGICGKQELGAIKPKGEALNNEHLISAKKIKEMFSIMANRQDLFTHTGGSHAASIFNDNYELLTIKEDIGRHNAVDKSIGQLINNDMLKQALCMLVSGRVSYEIVSKAFFAKISIIIAVSACSSLAIDYAKEFGICLIGFSREHKMTIYANPSKIKL
ncbi:formate dehydrogenase accessory sulfurtransferase FdhD [Flavobacteriaceae bacterium S356]|uniref:Sulfur carrier protein FdhD n=1 Tax=Asprobacillus argus TaxID=3076534 RepID=A0ABU3LIX0_9FLAO|nr:formate dehydrogenase accessory sulfurtransferase FdhD [Flavobacteriaceae bacterium S356]